MKGDSRWLVIIAVALCFVVLVGEVVTYGNVYRYDVTADDEGNVSIHDSGSHVYDSVLTDNGSFEAVTKLYVYYDSEYGSNVELPLIEIGAKPLTQDYYISQLVNNLGYYGFRDVTIVNAVELREVLSSPGNAKGTGLVILSGTIPDTVYGASTVLLHWINAGGSLYWAGGLLGKYVSHSDGTFSEMSGDCQTPFLGSECLNPITDNPTHREIRVFGSVEGNDYRNSLSLKNNNVLYAVDQNLLTVEHLSVGYSDGQYSSITFVRNGSGMVCVLGGDYSNNQRMDLATIIPAGLSYCSTELEHHSGKVTRGTVSEKFDLTSSTNKLVLFTYLGGDFSVYGRSYYFN